MTTATMTPPPATDAPPEPLTPPERLLRIAGALSPGQRVTIDPVTWEEYEGLMDAREAAGRHFRLTYDQGSLEIMPTSNLHERLKKILALLIEGWLDETGGRYLSSGGLTIRRPDRQRGFEPDECYYVQNWAKVKGLGEIDFTSHPPDLTVEVEVSRTAAPRLPVFAGLNIPEVWRYDGERLTVLLLDPAGVYLPSTVSRAIPNFPFTEAPRFLTMAATEDHGTISREFRTWVRALPPAAPPA